MLETMEFKGKIIVKTGLHIGGIKESFKIGGVDNYMIKIGGSGEPYIPGSSLKGKIRFLLEKKYENDKEKQNLINIAFGYIIKSEKDNQTETIPSRIIFRDAELIKKNESYESVIEIKPENTIDRKNGNAKPRFIERVVPGTEFQSEILINMFNNDKIKEIIELLIEGLDLLQKNYLGGSGSRGYGKVDVSEIIDNIKLKTK